MDKNLIKNIVELASQSGAEVKVVKADASDINEEVERPRIPLFKLEAGIKKEGDELFVVASENWHVLGELLLEMTPAGFDNEKVRKIFEPAKNAFKHCTAELSKYLKEEIEGAVKDEKERIRRKSC